MSAVWHSLKGLEALQRDVAEWKARALKAEAQIERERRTAVNVVKALAELEHVRTERNDCWEALRIDAERAARAERVIELLAERMGTTAIVLAASVGFGLDHGKNQK